MATMSSQLRRVHRSRLAIYDSMKKSKTAAEEYRDIFAKLHKYQHEGADNLILLLSRYVRGKADYKASYIELVAECTGVSSTGHITTTNGDIMRHVVMAIVEIDTGIAPLEKDINKAWEMFIEDYHSRKIK